MKKLLTRAIAAIMIAAAATVPASASSVFKFGPKVGMAINKFSMNQDAFASDNRAGFTGGVMIELNVPVINIGVDLSAMYVRRSAKIFNEAAEMTTLNTNFIDVPLHLKWKIGLPVAGKFLSPFIFTGPDFAFNCSKEIINDYKNRNFDVIWDFGVGLEFFSHLQIAASYGLGVTKAVKYVSPVNGSRVSGRNNCWTVTAAYLF